MSEAAPVRKRKKKKRPMPRWAEGAVYAGVRSAVAVTQIAGVNNSMRAMRSMGGVFAQMPFNRGRLQRAIDNISWCFPHWDAQRVHDHAVEAYRHLFMLAVEMGAAPRLITDDGYAAYVELGDLTDGLMELLSGRPCILVTGHCGNWELLGYTMALLGFPMHALYRPLDLPSLNAWVLESRTRRGLTLVDKFGASRRLPAILEAGAPVGFIADQNAGDRGLFVPFFDRMASAYKAIGLMAMRHNAVVVCGQARRLSGMSAERGDHHGEEARNSQVFRYQIDVLDVIRPEHWADHEDPLFYITARYRRGIEAMVRAAPEQYLWMHRYWKSRPPYEHKGRPIPSKLLDKVAALPWTTPESLRRLVERSERDAKAFVMPGRATVVAMRGDSADTSPPAPAPAPMRPAGPEGVGGSGDAGGSSAGVNPVAKMRTVLLVKVADPVIGGDDDGGEVRQPSMLDAVPLGSMGEVVELLRDFNVAPDGAPDSPGVLYGPGFTLQLPMVGPDDPVAQALVSIGEEETAWPVLARLCVKLRWKLMDPSSGRMFG